MRWSQMFIPTLREEPSQVEAVSHRLLLRAGYIRQLTAGVYSLLPLGQMVRLKLIEIIREEMNEIGGQEFLLSALQPLELWDESGRTTAVSDIMFRFKDRKGSDMALGPTHEEIFTSIARTNLFSYKQLPQIWYQIQTKFRDEARPKGGLLRVREFTMKDSYSFDIDSADLDISFEKHRQAYIRIFDRCGVRFKAVQADSGSMGGSTSIEFMVQTSAGEDTLVICSNCDYAANLERAASQAREQAPEAARLELSPLEQFATPNIRTIKDLELFEGGVPAESQIKTLVYFADGAIILALVQGDQELNEAKLQLLLSAASFRQATDEEIFASLGAHAGSLGACSVKAGSIEKIKRIIADHRLRGRVNMVTGANKDNFHLRFVSVQRDIAVTDWADLHTVKENENCMNCGTELTLAKGLEIGHIFKLGTKYSEAMKATVLGPDGSRSPLVMGSYGIGVERLIAAIAELSHDERGLIWPASIAPFHVLIVLINNEDQTQVAAAEKLCSDLEGRGLTCLIDDRDERAGVKFNDAELIGIPLRITIGKKISTGHVEILERASNLKKELPLSDSVQFILDKCRPQYPLAMTPS